MWTVRDDLRVSKARDEPRSPPSPPGVLMAQVAGSGLVVAAAHGSSVSIASRPRQDEPSSRRRTRPIGSNSPVPLPELIGDLESTERGDPRMEAAIPHREWYSREALRRFHSWGPGPRHYPPVPRSGALARRAEARAGDRRGDAVPRLRLPAPPHPRLGPAPRTGPGRRPASATTARASIAATSPASSTTRASASGSTPTSTTSPSERIAEGPDGTASRSVA